jgi:hypothetical protein
MTLNITAYAIYLTLTIFIIVRVGKICHRNGNVFVSELIPDHMDLCHKINDLLLLGYYLLNIGYCAISLIWWDKITSAPALILALSTRTSYIICIISVMHYLNIFIITKYIKKIIH